MRLVVAPPPRISPSFTAIQVGDEQLDRPRTWNSRNVIQADLTVWCGTRRSSLGGSGSAEWTFLNSMAGPDPSRVEKIDSYPGRGVLAHNSAGDSHLPPGIVAVVAIRHDLTRQSSAPRFRIFLTLPDA